ncbi:MAG: hypothetical protein JKY87_00230 [Mariprofundus sp.]|nr:hypothetical protein [Mariprofundus sp.]
MSLVHCFECEKEVSESAKVCPHCGVKNPSVSPEAEAIEQKKANKGCLSLIAVVLAISVIASFFGDDEDENFSFVPEISEAQPYTIIKTYSYPTPPDKQGFEFTIFSKQATTLEKRSQTAIKAALDILKDKGLYEVQIKMNAYPDNNKFYFLAYVKYQPYKKNTWGDEKEYVWDVTANKYEIVDGKIIDNGKSYPLEFTNVTNVLQK